MRHERSHPSRPQARRNCSRPEEFRSNNSGEFGREQYGSRSTNQFDGFPTANHRMEDRAVDPQALHLRWGRYLSPVFDKRSSSRDSRTRFRRDEPKRPQRNVMADGWNRTSNDLHPTRRSSNRRNPDCEQFGHRSVVRTLPCLGNQLLRVRPLRAFFTVGTHDECNIC